MADALIFTIPFAVSLKQLHRLPVWQTYRSFASGQRRLVHPATHKPTVSLFPPLLGDCEDGKMVRIPVGFFTVSCFFSRNSGTGGGSMLRLNHKNFLNPEFFFFILKINFQNLFLISYTFLFAADF